MPIGGNYFVYNNVPSRPHGLQFAYVNTSMQDAQIEGAREYITSKLPKEDRYFILGRQLDQPYSREVEMISEEPLSPTKQRELIRWLFYQPDYRKLVILTPEYAGIYYNCVFTDETAIMAGDGCHGWKCTLQCDSGFAWEEKKTFLTELSYPLTVTLTDLLGNKATAKVTVPPGKALLSFRKDRVGINRNPPGRKSVGRGRHHFQ